MSAYRDSEVGLSIRLADVRRRTVRLQHEIRSATVELDAAKRTRRNRIAQARAAVIPDAIFDGRAFFIAAAAAAALATLALRLLVL